MTGIAAEAVMGHNANAANIEAMVKEDPKIVFRDPGVLPALVEAVRARISAHPYDLTSAKGRSLITKLKSSVTSIKTLLDDTGKTRIFQNQPEAEAFLLCHGFTSEDLEHFYFVEVPENEEQRMRF